MSSLSQIAADYISDRRKSVARHLDWFAEQATIADAVSAAALAKRPDGKRQGHQRRIPKDALNESRRRLMDCLSSLQEARTFEELHDIVASQTGSIDGIGELTIYDTALRIGAKLGLEPAVVFLHAGTRSGATKLGLDVSRGVLSPDQLPREFAGLRPREIEDLLCIYKKSLGAGSGNGSVGPCGNGGGDDCRPAGRGRCP